MMKQMMIMTIALLVIGINPASAQKKGKNPAKKMERLQSELSLTDYQVDELTVGLEAIHANAKSVDRSELSKEEKKALRKQTKLEVKALYEGLLDAEQLAKFETLREERKDKKGKRGKRGKRGSDNATEG